MEPDISSRTYDDLIGCTAYDMDGDRLGEIKEIYYDDVTGRPEWVEVKTGIFTGTRLVPINGSMIRDDNDLQLAYTTEAIKTAPDFDIGEIGSEDHLEASQEQELYAHYGFDWNATEGNYGYGTSYRSERFDRDYPLPAPTTTTQSDVVEEVDVSTTRPKMETETTTRKARLRKYTVHGTETVEVPVSHEEVRLEVEGEERSR